MADPSGTAPSAPATPSVAAAYLASPAHLGVRVTNPEAFTDAALEDWPALHAAVVELRGGGATAPLFPGFPEQLPTFDAARVRFTLTAVRLMASQPVSGQLLEVSDDDVRAAMDFSTVGWWPASSVPQDVDAARLAEAHQAMLPRDPRIEWIDVRLVSTSDRDAALARHVVDCAYSASSLNRTVLDELGTLVDVIGCDDVELSEIRFAEIRATFTARLFAAASAGDEAAAARLVDAALTPDDVLRLFAALTGTDVSLHGEVRFPRMRRAQRRLVLACLESSPRRRDVFRRRGLWLAVAKSLHVGEHAERYPAAAATFAELRESRYDTTSTASRFEAHLAAGEAGTAARLAAVESPGLLLRQLRRLAAAGADRGALVEALGAAAGAAPLRTLLAVHAQVLDNGATYPRRAIAKSGAPLVIDRAPGHLSVDDATVDALADVLDAAIAARCAEKGSWAGERVWIDPATERLGVPDQLRSTSDSMLVLDRGSRIPLGDAEVLRVFVHWREPRGRRSDLDLSLMALDAEFSVVDQVSWTNLSNHRRGAQHLPRSRPRR